MSGPRSADVARVADWECAGTSYSVHVGRAVSLGGRVSILAIGPARAYRSVVLSADQATRVLTELLGAWDVGERTQRVESLLGLGDDAPGPAVH